MKYLSDYVEEEQSSLIKELGAFFAFSDKQFEEGVAENKDKLLAGEKWASMGMGMYIPKHNADVFVKRHAECIQKGIKQDLADNGRSGVLQRELMNYEIGLSWDGVDDPNFRGGIEGYGFTEEEVQSEYKKHMATHEY